MVFLTNLTILIYFRNDEHIHKDNEIDKPYAVQEDPVLLITDTFMWLVVSTEFQECVVGKNIILKRITKLTRQQMNNKTNETNKINA